ATDPKVKVAMSKDDADDGRAHYRDHPIIEFGEKFALEREQLDPNLVAFLWARTDALLAL
ncbi:unnamed protein product, partial [Prorocentrum cordatum]